MIKEIYNWFRYSLPRGIINLFLWFKVIWGDRQYDHFYIYKLLHHKLTLMEKHIREKGHSVDNEKDAKKIKICVLLLDRLINDVYFEMAHKDFDKKWGECQMKTSPDENNKDYVKLDFVYENVKTEEDKKQQKKEQKRIWQHESYLRKQDIAYLFKMMNKHIEHWWD